MKLLPPPELSGWQVQEHGVTSNSDGSKIIFVWEFKNGEENSLTIQARTCKTVENAANYFLNTADSTTTTEIPYIKGPEELGAVSAVDGQDGTSYFWFYKNVFIKVTKYPKSKVSALHIALWVQKELEASQIEPRRGQ